MAIFYWNMTFEAASNRLFRRKAISGKITVNFSFLSILDNKWEIQYLKFWLLVKFLSDSLASSLMRGCYKLVTLYSELLMFKFHRKVN